MTWMDAVRVMLVGIGATAVMDAWLLALRRAGMPTLDYALVGRWAGHLRRGRFAHARIGEAAPIPGERPLGWAIHYAVGIAFAALMVAVQGLAWLREPALLPAVAMGMATVVVPLLVMQPAMGAGFAASKTPTPLRNCLRSLATHAVFGAGLFLSAVLIELSGA
ncbi:DUF2938 domain-containing protein [Xanthomonas sp. NCPPB 2654]|uniref:DUF2938 domain-containing protein n=1 Tax=unclassified Xanthomonas TaxID=2643310 RepID=UPI0021E0ACB8|nr:MULTISPECIES: DUF2938 domain-containing protein [unclassified Xanthomonas]MDL5364646.1 DUF2938 domain-containing protein [Xanthomonas sp. NCPPB 2654]UYC21960.1 DUF2938 domain-containing protein [Xanthomonas sp. CFBP 8443]